MLEYLLAGKARLLWKALDRSYRRTKGSGRMPGPLLLFAFIHFIITRPAPAPNRMNMHANLESFNLFDCAHGWIRDM
jgi:hypothetical protein